jgi:general secretion pathway protein L
VTLRRRGKEKPLGRFALNPSELAALPRDKARPTVLRLRGEDVLTKSVALPLAAERHLAQALGFELDRETPFDADELYWGYRIEHRDRRKRLISVCLILVPRTQLMRLLEVFNLIGLPPSVAEVVLASGHCEKLGLDSRPPGSDQSKRWLRRGIVAGCSAMATVAIALPFVRQELALDRLDVDIAAQHAAISETSSLNRELDLMSKALGAVAKERREVGDPLAVLANLTRVLPDDTYLTELTLRQRKITFSGRSAAASRLIGTLAADNKFHDPAFAAPVTRTDGAGAEAFTITSGVAP